MNSQAAHPLSLDELFQLVHFYAESGVEWTLEDEPQDRFAEFIALQAARSRPAEAPQAGPADSGGMSRQAPQRAQAKVAPTPPPSRPAAIPDAEAALEAARVAAAAGTVEELAAAVDAFSGCNLRNSARSTVFVTGPLSASVAIAAGLPSAEDDREGRPFSGPAGAMLARMLGGIGLSMDEVMLFNLIPWRPPGNRPPTAHEIEICRPFSTRLVALARPKLILALGNFPAKFFSGSSETIHGLRGRWLEAPSAEGAVPVMATFHPQDLMAAPACKRLAWQDLLAFRQALTI
jgi:DNA polymerase